MPEQAVVGVEDLSKKLAALIKAATGKQLDYALMIGGAVIETEAKRNIKSKGLIDLGNLRASMRAQLLKPGIVIIGTHVIYAAIHEFGGTIRPKRKPFLVFKIKGGGWVRTKAVTIPARPYLRPAFTKHKGRAVKAVGAALAAQINRTI